jgi:hypothetical protein
MANTPDEPFPPLEVAFRLSDEEREPGAPRDLEMMVQSPAQECPSSSCQLGEFRLDAPRAAIEFM